MTIFQGFGRAISALTNGAIVAQIPNSAVSGGNARGANAVDLQTARASAAQVASGAQSVVAGGQNNTASGTQSTVVGGISNSASGLGSSVVGGIGNDASGGSSWVPGAWGASTRGVTGRGAWSGAGNFGTQGDAQAGEHVLRRQTTDATPTRLTADGAAAGASNTVNLPNNSAYRVRVMVVGRQNTAGGGRYSFEQSALIVRDANAASTTVTLGGGEVITAGTVTGWNVALAADTTNGGLAITVTGAAATTINWVARVMSVEVVA